MRTYFLNDKQASVLSSNTGYILILNAVTKRLHKTHITSIAYYTEIHIGIGNTKQQQIKQNYWIIIDNTLDLRPGTLSRSGDVGATDRRRVTQPRRGRSGASCLRHRTGSCGWTWKQRKNIIGFERFAIFPFALQQRVNHIAICFWLASPNIIWY